MLRDPPSRLSLPDVRFIFFSVLALVLVATPACAQDCDGNGISDAVEIAASPELDCNGNGILDLCETGGYVSPPIEQDVCELAQWICPGEVHFGSTVGANSDWYAYAPESDGTLHIALRRLTPWPNNPGACVSNGCPSSGGTSLKCGAVPWGIDGDEYLFMTVQVFRGSTYHIEVFANPGYQGSYSIEIAGTGCVFEPDCDGDGVPDDCEESPECGPGVLCYDDGDGGADLIANEANPASFLVRFSVPEAFGGPRKVTRVTWYAGSGTIESPKAVIRGDLAGGFGTSQACVVQDVTAVVPNAFNQVDVSQNANQLVVHGGDIFYAGVYAARMSLGGDTAWRSMVVSTAQTDSDIWVTTYPCHTISVPTPVVGGGVKIPCWASRNYKLDALGTHPPEELVSMSTLGPATCHYNRWRRPEYLTNHTSWSGTSQVTEFMYFCQIICRQDFQLRAQDWLIRVSLSGSCSPELISGCTEDGSLICDTFKTFTPTATGTITPTPSITPTFSPTGTGTPTATVTPTFTETPTLRPIPEYDDPVLVAELDSDGGDAYPHLTGDLLEMFFVSDRTGDTDIWSATRESIDGAWNPPFPVTELNSTSIDTCPAVSTDGLEIFFSSRRDLAPTNNFNRVYRSTRLDRSSPWSVPVEVLELRPPQMQDYFSHPSCLSEDSLRIYTSRRFGSDFDLYVSARSGLGAPFSGPTPLPGNANTASSEAHIGLSGDELTMIFGRVTGAWNLFGAKRSTPTGAFQVPREMTELNDPTCATLTGCVSSDMTWIWFSSDRPECPGLHDIYVAKLLQTSTPTVTPTATATPTLSTGVNGSLWMFR